MPRIQILLIYTKVPRSTKKLVAGVRERYEKVRLYVAMTTSNRVITQCWWVGNKSTIPITMKQVLVSHRIFSWEGKCHACDGIVCIIAPTRGL